MNPHQAKTLILLFNRTFADTNHTELVDVGSEPLYSPGGPGLAHQLGFAHGFFASALHEIAHWCIAGPKRRQIVDFGYWYHPDGRTAQQQRAFEQAEVKPQALEWIFSLAAGFRFVISADNLSAGTSADTNFKAAVQAQAQQYLQSPQLLPADAAAWCQVLTGHFRQGRAVTIADLEVGVL